MEVDRGLLADTDGEERGGLCGDDVMTDAEYRAKLKALHLCTRCKTQDAYTLRGRALCAECAAIIAARRRSVPTDVKRAQRKRQYLIDVANGICPRCGTRKAKPGSVICWMCTIKATEYMRAYRARQNTPNHEKQCKQYAQHRPSEDHPWRRRICNANND